MLQRASCTNSCRFHHLVQRFIGASVEFITMNINHQLVRVSASAMHPKKKCERVLLLYSVCLNSACVYVDGGDWVWFVTVHPSPCSICTQIDAEKEIKEGNIIIYFWHCYHGVYHQNKNPLLVFFFFNFVKMLSYFLPVFWMWPTDSKSMPRNTSFYWIFVFFNYKYIF